MVICFMHIFIFPQCSILHHFLFLHKDLTMQNITVSGLQPLCFVCVHLITIKN
jgi:tRNA A-37 threonylcarbamoyl transferase component Bud32